MAPKAGKKEAPTAKKGEAPKAAKGEAPRAEKEEVKSKSSGGGNRWLNFVKSFREKNALKEDKIAGGDILQEAGHLWKEMSDTEKDKYGAVAAPKTKK